MGGKDGMVVTTEQGERFSTAKAVYLATWQPDFVSMLHDSAELPIINEDLYQGRGTKKNTFFLLCIDTQGCYSVKTIQRIDARKWVRERGQGTAIYEEFFGKVG